MTPDEMAALCSRAYHHMRPWSARQFADSLAQPTHLLEAHPQAFVLGQVVADEAEILALATDPDRQRQGHATRALLGFHAAAALRGAGRILLEVAEPNTAARAFYRAHGYDEIGRRKAYYPQAGAPPADAVIMARALP